MSKRTTGEVAGHPLWMLPMMLIICFGGIEALHTMAHLHQEIDVHGVCKRNKEYIESQNQDDDW